jgi:hypothetical protein
VTAVPDGGCCGWAYEGSDQALLSRHGQVSVLDNESDCDDNRHDAVRCYTADVRLAPGNAMLAYTVASTARAGTQIRLASEGKENAEVWLDDTSRWHRHMIPSEVV